MANVNIKKLLESNLPTYDNNCTVSFTDKGNLYITRDDGTQLKVSDMIFVTSLPTQNQLQNKIYITPNKKLYMWNISEWVVVGEPTAVDIPVIDVDNNFISNPKTVENTLKELYELIATANETIANMQEGKKVISNTNGKSFSYNILTMILDMSTISGALINAVIDINNTSVTTNLNYEMLINGQVVNQGVIPMGSAISFETQRQDLIINVLGEGNITINTTVII